MVYFELSNDGAADTLISVTTPAAVHAAVHSTTTANGVMEMRQLDALQVPAHARISFAPGGMHVMLSDLARPLREAEHVELKLVFRRAGELRVDATVAALGALSAP